MLRGCSCRLVLVLLAVARSLAYGAEASESITEIEITGQRALYQLRLQIFEAEDTLFGLWNELNDNDLYDIQCVSEARTGTLIKQRNCQPRFVTEATRENARDFFSQAFGNSNGVAVSPTDPVAEISRHTPIYQQKLKEMIQQNPQLLEAAVKHQTLLQRLAEQTRLPPAGE